MTILQTIAWGLAGLAAAIKGMIRRQYRGSS
jgi:hypothetical protein